MKKKLALILALLMLVSLFAGCGSDSGSGDAEASAAAFTGKDIDTEPIKLAYISLSSSGATNISVEIAFAEQLSMYENVTLTYFDGEYSPTTQNNAIQECITQKYDAIILEPCDGEALNTSVTEAEAAGIPVITVNPNVTAVHSCHIQGNDYASGVQGAQYIYAAGGETGTYIILDCPASAKASTRMGTGFEDWMTANTKWEQLDHQYIENFSQENANTTMRDLLTKYDNITAVYGATDDIAMGAVQAIQAAGRDGILVWGQTGFYNAFLAIEDGSMYGTSWCDVYAQYQSIVSTALYLVKTGITAANAGYTETPVINCALIAVTRDNVDQLLPLSRWTYESDYIK